MKSTIAAALTRSSAVKSQMAADAALVSQIEKGAQALLRTIKASGTIFACGNGGSACDSMHLTEELIARYKKDRPGIKAMHMLDPGTMSCWTNDYNYETLFERYVKTFCGPNDTIVAFSTSGNSRNVINALQAAKSSKTFTIGMLGRDGGAMKSLCDLPIIVPAPETERIQEAHITIVHIFCEIIEASLWG